MIRKVAVVALTIGGIAILTFGASCRGVAMGEVLVCMKWTVIPQPMRISYHASSIGRPPEGILCAEPGWFPQGALIIPVWLVAAMFLAYPIWISTFQARRQLRLARDRSEHGLCVRCSYDLTGNVSGACPECGRKIEEP